jgi:myo-inositol-1(or 4)-monophosphatase
MDYAKTSLEVEHIARAAGTFLLRQWRQLRPDQVREKEANQLVSYVDEEAEALITEHVRQLLPEAAVWGEESGFHEGAQTGLRWVIDPLDGTTNFVFGLPGFCVSIALWDNDRPQIGAVCDPVHGTLYTAVRGEGARCDGRPLQLGGTRTMRHTLLATGFPTTDFSRQEALMAFLSHAMRHSRGIRRFGSAAMDMAMVAAGHFGAFVEYGLKPWDVAAGILLVEEAGGVVTDFSGGRAHCLDGSEILACHPGLQAEIRPLVSSYFKGA